MVVGKGQSYNMERGEDGARVYLFSTVTKLYRVSEPSLNERIEPLKKHILRQFAVENLSLLPHPVVVEIGFLSETLEL